MPIKNTLAPFANTTALRGSNINKPNPTTPQSFFPNNISVSDTAIIKNDLSVSGSFDLSTNLIVDGTSTFNSDVNVFAEITTNNLTTTYATTLNTLTVNSTSSLEELDVVSSTTLNGSLDIQASTSISNDISIYNSDLNFYDQVPPTTYYLFVKYKTLSSSDNEYFYIYKTSDGGTTRQVIPLTLIADDSDGLQKLQLNTALGYNRYKAINNALYNNPNTRPNASVFLDPLETYYINVTTDYNDGGADFSAYLTTSNNPPSFTYNGLLPTSGGSTVENYLIVLDSSTWSIQSLNAGSSITNDTSSTPTPLLGITGATGNLTTIGQIDTQGLTTSTLTTTDTSTFGDVVTVNAVTNIVDNSLNIKAGDVNVYNLAYNPQTVYLFVKYNRFSRSDNEYFYIYTTEDNGVTREIVPFTLIADTNDSIQYLQENTALGYNRYICARTELQLPSSGYSNTFDNANASFIINPNLTYHINIVTDYDDGGATVPDFQAYISTSSGSSGFSYVNLLSTGTLAPNTKDYTISIDSSTWSSYTPTSASIISNATVLPSTASVMLNIDSATGDLTSLGQVSSYDMDVTATLTSNNGNINYLSAVNRLKNMGNFYLTTVAEDGNFNQPPTTEEIIIEGSNWNLPTSNSFYMLKAGRRNYLLPTPVGYAGKLLMLRSSPSWRIADTSVVIKIPVTEYTFETALNTHTYTSGSYSYIELTEGSFVVLISSGYVWYDLFYSGSISQPNAGRVALGGN